jgi:HK97 family phage major capsid protein
MENEMKDIINEIGKTASAHRELADRYHAEKKEFGDALGDTKASLEKVNSALDTLNEQKAALDERLAKIEVASQRSDVGADTKSETVRNYETAFNKFLRGGSKDELKDAFEAAKAEYKSMSVGTPSDGGYLVPEDLSGQIAKIVFETSPMRQVALIQQCSADKLQGIELLDEFGAGWVAETDPRSNTTTPTVGRYSIDTHEVYALPVITTQLIEDSLFDMERFVATEGAAKIARVENSAFVVGDGTGKPQGWATKAGVESILSGADGAITADSILNTVYALKSEYRTNAKWALSREGIAAARLLKDLNDNYIWQPGLNGGQADTLAGYEVVEMNDIPAFAANGVVAGFADWSRAYSIVDRVGLSILPDPYSTKGSVEFYLRKRVGGDVILTDAIKTLSASDGV